MDNVLKEKVENKNVFELIFEREKSYDSYEQNDVFDMYGNYMFPTETVIEKPNIISGAFVM